MIIQVPPNSADSARFCVMPRYFFHLRDQLELHEDEEGMDLPHLEAALGEALRTDRELRIDPAGLYGLEFEITDENGRTLLKVPVQERRRNRDLAPQCSPEQERRHIVNKPKSLH